MIQDVPPTPRRHILRREPVILLAKVAGYFVLTIALRLGLGALLRALFAAWNVNPQTVSRAPAWAQTFFAWQGSLITLIGNSRLNRSNASTRSSLTQVLSST